MCGIIYVFRILRTAFVRAHQGVVRTTDLTKRHRTHTPSSKRWIFCFWHLLQNLWCRYSDQKLHQPCACEWGQGLCGRNKPKLQHASLSWYEVFFVLKCSSWSKSFSPLRLLTVLVRSLVLKCSAVGGHCHFCLYTINCIFASARQDFVHN